MKSASRFTPSGPGPAVSAALAAFTLLALGTGCRDKGPSAQEGVVQLEKAFPRAAENDVVCVAIAAAKTNDYETSIVALQTAKSVPGMTANQLATVEATAQALTAELVRRADSGDAKAKAMLEAIARTRSQ